MSTNQPVEVYSATHPSVRPSGCVLPVRTSPWAATQKPISHFVLDIDIPRNEPRIIVAEKLPNTSEFQGTRMSVLIEGNWTAYRVRWCALCCGAVCPCFVLP